VSDTAGDDVVTTATTGPNGINKVNGVTGVKSRRQRTTKPKHPAKPKHLAKPEQSVVRPENGDHPERTIHSAPTAEPEQTALPKQLPQPALPVNAGLFAEDEVTEWFGTDVNPRSAVKPEPAVTPPAAGRRRSRGRAVLLVALALALAGVGSLIVVAVRQLTGSTANTGVSSAMLQEEAAVRDQAAAWVALQVSRSVVVSCDQVMCDALTAHGFPSRDLLVLGPTSLSPQQSAVVIETAAVHDLFGSSLASAWAPAVLASFGSGPAGITVRVIAPHGAAAFQNALTADMNARKTSGAALLNDNQITVSATAQQQLASGQVDSRLMLAIAALAGQQPISIVDFGNTGPGVNADLPLCFADLAESDQASHLGSVAYVRSMRSYLSTVNAQYRPARTETVVIGGQAVLRVEFTAPSPLGVFGPQ
jgi:hypothetical protein